MNEVVLIKTSLVIRVFIKRFLKQLSYLLGSDALIEPCIVSIDYTVELRSAEVVQFLVQFFIQ